MVLSRAPRYRRGKFSLFQIYVLFSYLIKTKHTLQVRKWNVTFLSRLSLPTGWKTQHPILNRSDGSSQTYSFILRSAIVSHLNLFLIRAICQKQRLLICCLVYWSLICWKQNWKWWEDRLILGGPDRCAHFLQRERISSSGQLQALPDYTSAARLFNLDVAKARRLAIQSSAGFNTWTHLGKVCRCCWSASGVFKY